MVLIYLKHLQMKYLKPLTKISLSLALLLFSAVTNGQNTFQKILERSSVNLSAGIANYGGDLQQKRVTFNKAGTALGLGLSYSLTSRLHVRGEYLFAKIGADDKQNSKLDLQERNLNFKANLHEVSATLQYDFMNIETYKFTPYIFAGVAYFKASPYTFDVNGNKYYLAGLGTEGQGLNGDTKPYNTKHISIPFGGGLKMMVTDIIGVSFEAGFRKTFTDYIDDVSGNYADFTALNNYNPISAELAFRSDEIKSGSTYPSTATLRGNPKNKDYYYFGLIKLQANLSFLTGSKVGCPKNVF